MAVVEILIQQVSEAICQSETVSDGKDYSYERNHGHCAEEAEGYRALIDDFGLTQEEISKRVGKSRPAVANAMRILALPQAVLKLVSDGKLSSGHARSLLPLTKFCDEAKIIEIANDVVEKDITVRELENLAKRMENNANSSDEKSIKKESKAEDIYFKEIAEDLSAASVQNTDKE